MRNMGPPGRYASLKSCWVTRDGNIYDVTEFLVDHPGGDDLILCEGETKDPEGHHVVMMNVRALYIGNSSSGDTRRGYE